MYDMDDEGGRQRENLQRGDRGKSKCESRLQACWQYRISADHHRLRENVSDAEFPAVRHLPGSPRKLLRNGRKVCPDEERRHECLRRSCRIQKLYCRTRNRLQDGTETATAAIAEMQPATAQAR